ELPVAGLGGPRPGIEGLARAHHDTQGAAPAPGPAARAARPATTISTRGGDRPDRHRRRITSHRSLRPEPFTPLLRRHRISLLVYPIFALDFLLLRGRPWVRVALVAGLFVALQVAHAVYEPPADQHGTWASGVSSVAHARG